MFVNYWSGSNTPKRLNLSNNAIINVTGFSNLNPEIRFDSDGNLYYSIAGANKIWKVDKNCPGLSDPNATSLDFTSYKSPLYNWITSNPGTADDGVIVNKHMLDILMVLNLIQMEFYIFQICREIII